MNQYDTIAFIDADDYWKPHHITNLMNLVKIHNSCDVYSSNYQISRKGKLISTKWSHCNRHTDGALDHFFMYNMCNSTLNCSNILIKVPSLEKIGLFNEATTHYEDIDWFIRIGIHLKTAFSFEETVIVNENSPNRSDQVKLQDRKFPDFDIYETYYESSIGLKKYIDINKFSIAIAYRMDNDIIKAIHYQKNIDLNNLSIKQQQLLAMSAMQLKTLYKTKKALEYIGIELRTG